MDREQHQSFLFQKIFDFACTDQLGRLDGKLLYVFQPKDANALTYAFAKSFEDFKQNHLRNVVQYGDEQGLVTIVEMDVRKTKELLGALCTELGAPSLSELAREHPYGLSQPLIKYGMLAVAEPATRAKYEIVISDNLVKKIEQHVA